MTEFAKRSLKDKGVDTILRWAYGMEARQSGAKIMRWPEGRPPKDRPRSILLRVLTALHANDCASHRFDYRGRRYPCDCGALTRQTATGRSTFQSDPNRLTAMDMIAEAAMIRHRAAVSQREPYCTVLDAYYTLPYDRPLEQRKQAAVDRLAQICHDETGRPVDLMRDAVLVFCGDRPSKSFRAWARHLDMPLYRVQEWTSAREGSVRSVMNGWLVMAHEAAEYLLDLGGHEDD